jgi:hypothetical protein
VVISDNRNVAVLLHSVTHDFVIESIFVSTRIVPLMAYCVKNTSLCQKA